MHLENINTSDTRVIFDYFNCNWDFFDFFTKRQLKRILSGQERPKSIKLLVEGGRIRVKCKVSNGYWSIEAGVDSSTRYFEYRRDRLLKRLAENNNAFLTAASLIDATNGSKSVLFETVENGQTTVLKFINTSSEGNKTELIWKGHE